MVWDQDVAGSNPVIPTKGTSYEVPFFFYKKQYSSEKITLAKMKTEAIIFISF